MFVIANFIHSLTNILSFLMDAYVWVLIIRVVMSWVAADPTNSLVRAIVALTEPVLAPFRRILPPFKTGGWDLSPLLAVLAIKFLQSFLVPTLHQLADRLS